MKYQVVPFILFCVLTLLIPFAVFSQAPSVEDAQFKLGIDLYQQGRFQDAITEFRRLLFDMKTSKYRDASYFYAANAYLSLGKVTEARSNFRIVADTLRKSRYHSDALYLYGRCEYLLKNYPSSIELFDSYLKLYPSLQYADNSLYWKAESLLGMGMRGDARDTFTEVLKRYPTGNKADAARFKLRLMELEDRMRKQEEESASVEVFERPAEIPEAEVDRRIRDIELQYREEIEKLNNQIDLLHTELNNLKEVGAGSEDERKAQIEEKVKALIAWESILKVKEEALNQKEEKLNRGIERVESIISELEQQANE